MSGPALASSKPLARTLHPAALTSQDTARWQALQAAHSDYMSPLFSPAFAQTIGKVRADARVTLIEAPDGTLLCVLAAFAKPGGRARALGAPFADYAGPVMHQAAELSLTDIIALAGLSAWRTDFLVDPWHHFKQERGAEDSSHIIRPGELAPAAFLESRRALHPKRFKNFRRLDRQAQTELGELSFQWGRMSAKLRERLFALKSAQYQLSGLVDLTTASRARQILDAVEASPNGFQTSLWAGDSLISAHFGFRDGAAFHPWIAAFDNAFSHYSPGNLLLTRIIENLQAMELAEYDLAEGHEHYKKYFSNASRTTYRAAIYAPSLPGRLNAWTDAAWSMAAGRNTNAPLQRLRRRMDHAAASESRLGARIKDIGTALRHRRGTLAPAGHGTTSETAAD